MEAETVEDDPPRDDDAFGEATEPQAEAAEEQVAMDAAGAAGLANKDTQPLDSAMYEDDEEDDDAGCAAGVHDDKENGQNSAPAAQPDPLAMETCQYGDDEF